MAAIMNYFEIGSPDPTEARRFYGSLFDWTFGDPSPQSYQMVNADEGGLWDITALGGATWAIFYVQVEDVAATISHAESLGATVAVPLVDGGAHRVRAPPRPHGNRFGVWRPKQPT